MVSTNTNAGLNDDVRTEAIVIPVQKPLDDMEIPGICAADWPFKITRVVFSTAIGNVRVYVYNNGALVHFDVAHTAGYLLAVPGGAVEALPNSTAASNYTVSQDDRLSILLDAPSSGCAGLEVQISYQRTQANVAT